MGINKFAPAALLLWGAVPVVAHAQETPSFAQPAEDREQWITLGEDALESEVEAPPPYLAPDALDTFSMMLSGLR